MALQFIEQSTSRNMGCNVEACSECTHKCLLLHGNKTKSSPIMTSFFKIMIGNQCDQVLFLPPKFAPTVSELIDQKTFLEDSSGQQWEVTISSLNGSFAIHQGWNSFFLDHKLKVGDFVVFNYIVGSHFVVKIYTDTGCEKLDCPENRNKRKRVRDNENYTVRDGPFHTIDNSSMTKQGSSTSVVSGSDLEVSQKQCKMNDVEEVIAKITSNCETSSRRPHSLSIVEYVEEPYYIINRDLGDKQGEDRCPMFDLSNFEMLTNNCDTDKSHKITVGDEIYTHQADASPKSQVEAALANNDPVGRAVVNRVVPSNAPDLELMEKNNELQKMDKIVTVSNKISCNSKSDLPLFTTVVKPEKNGKSISNISNGVVKKDHIAEEEVKAQPEIQKAIISQKKCTSPTNSNQTGQLKFTGKLDSNVSVTTGILNLQLGKVPQINVVDCGQSSDLIERENTVHPVVKIESLDVISCVIASDNEPFLELPSCLPLVKFPTRNRSMDRKVVHLRDPYMRVWPVLYHERPGFNLLSSGWEAFSKANNIETGDECIFGVENNSESICEVNIVRSKTSSPRLQPRYT
ncbi:hypothetical protein JRO89_XS13G0079700 [Xanthoceras sorbifolium]|uniref:TF-B3 domain-containing protein n=1 Tax=Xanthoceras sorbifolium TaxID=99658 RepID=A0ABQ8H778_9ROSI|nr:hypothetical protein JRO89_XS13G0079700 [Xanthoceras sorbifolium]